MRELFASSLFRRSVVAPGGVWFFLCIIYIYRTVGWGSLYDLLPYEIAGILLAIVMPIFFLILWFHLTTGQESSSWMTDEIHRQGQLIDEIQQNMDSLSESLGDSGKWSASDIAMLLQMPKDIVNLKDSQATGIDSLVEKLDQTTSTLRQDLLAVIPTDMASILDGQRKGIQDISNGLDQVLRIQGEAKSQIDFSEIRQQTALTGLINFVLNDINVSATRMLVKLMEAEERSRDEIRDFIQGLVNAYSVGDRSVFISVLQHQLAGNEERIAVLQGLSGAAPEVAADLSKIIKGAREISSMIEQFSEENMATILFDDATLRKLCGALEPHFSTDGAAIKFTVT